MAAKISSSAAEIGSRQTPQSALSDVEVMHAVAEGDRAALGELYTRFAPGLLGIALGILRSRERAEDVVHEVFIEAWQHAAEFDPARGSARSWLSVRTRCRALDRLRRGPEAREVSEWPPIATHVVEHSQRIDLEALAIRRSLAVLSPEQRELVIRSYFRDETCEQMSRSLALPLGTVKSRMAAALNKLREALKED